MKQEEFMESIYGCLERIENKVNGLYIPQSADGNSEADNSRMMLQCRSSNRI